MNSKVVNATLLSSSLINGAAGASTTATTTTNSQFKHTLLWNGIISHLKTKLWEMNQNNGNRLRKQQSRFVAASVGGMLLIRQNIIPNNGATSSPSTQPQTPANPNSETIFFSGAQCIDIVYNYLVNNQHSVQFERQITRDKCVKLCQIIMDSGVFEPVNRLSNKFDDSSIKIFKLSIDTSLTEIQNTNAKTPLSSSSSVSSSSGNEQGLPVVKGNKVDLFDDDDNYNKKSSADKENKYSFNKDHGKSDLDKNNNKSIKPNYGKESSSCGGVMFSKSRLLNKTNIVNTKLKRKLTSMKRSSTIHALLPDDDEPPSTSNAPTTTGNSTTTSASTKEVTPSTALKETQSANIADRLKPISNDEFPSRRASSYIKNDHGQNHERAALTSKKTTKLDRAQSIDNFDYNIKPKKENNKSYTHKLAQELLMTRQITRELIIEKLLSLIDLPIIEHLLSIDEKHDVVYCEALEHFETVIHNMSNLKLSSGSEKVKPDAERAVNTAPGNGNANDHATGSFVPKSCLNLVQQSFAILGQTYDFTKSDVKEEWRRSALDCLEFIDWECVASSGSKLESQSAQQHQLSASQNHIHQASSGNDKSLRLVLMKDVELYNLIKDYYASKHKVNSFFLDDSFQPLFTNILVFIKKNHYAKALEILNLSTLLLFKPTQAELKRLLKFLYLTANSTHAPRLCENKPNNSIILNHFAHCLINNKVIGFEESRLLLNFMLNNFDNLFKLNKSIQESIDKRKLLMQKYGQEEALLEKVYCKRLSSKEYVDNTKEQTAKALIDLINHIIDDPQISLKQKKLKLRALQRIHPEIYEKHFSNLF